MFEKGQVNRWEIAMSIGQDLPGFRIPYEVICTAFIEKLPTRDRAWINTFLMRHVGPYDGKFEWQTVQEHGQANPDGWFLIRVNVPRPPWGGDNWLADADWQVTRKEAEETLEMLNGIQVAWLKIRDLYGG